MQLLYHPASTRSTPHQHALGYSHPPRLPMSSEDFRRLRTGHASCGRLSRVRVRTLFTVPIVAVTACISITKNEKSYAIEIDQDRPIDSALAERKIIDPQDPGRGLRGRRGAMENTQDRIATQGHAQAGGHPRASCAARLAPEDTDCLGQPLGTLRIAGSEGRQAFRKGLALTCGGGTTETPDVQAEAHRVLHDREVTQVARIAAMHACRWGVTIRAGGLGGAGAGLDKQCGIGCGDVFYHKTREDKRKQRRQHTIGDTSYQEEKFCVSLQYTRWVIVWPRSTKPAEEPVSSGQVQARVTTASAGRRWEESVWMARCSPYSDTCRTCSSITKVYGCVKNHFPLSLAPGKPRFYVCKFGQYTKVTL